MNNLGIKNARSTIVENELTLKKKKEVDELKNSNGKNKIAYLKFCDYITKCDDKVGLSNLEQITLNAGIIYKHNYELISKIKNPDIILDFLIIVGDKDYRNLPIIADYLLNDKLIKRLKSLSSTMNNFEFFKERFITTVVFRAKILKQKIDITKLLDDFIIYYKENTNEFREDNSKGYYRARA